MSVNGNHDSSNSFGDASEVTATDFFDDPYWNMLQVIAWVTTYDPALVHMASDNFNGDLRHFEELNMPSGHRLCEVPSGPVDWLHITVHGAYNQHSGGFPVIAQDVAERQIVRAFEAGRLVARGIKIGESIPAEILSADWAYLELYEDEKLGISARNKSRPKKHELRFSGMKVRRDEVLSEWPRSSSEQVAAQIVPPKWNAKTVEDLRKATHWTERELEAACFGFPLTMYHDLCVPDAKREEVRGAIEQACKNGELVAERSGRGNAMYGGRWRIERLSAVRWVIGNCPNFPDQLTSANLPDIFAEQDAARENAGRYTLKQAADEIARNTGESADEFVEKFKRAVCARELAVHRPGERARYYPETVREFYEESYWDDLNSWLGANEPRIEWRFPEPSKTIEAASVPRDRLNLGSLSLLETDDLGELRTGGELAESESPALDTCAGADAKLAAMFDAVGVSALETMFPAKGKWQGWANKAKENHLDVARSARASFNPYLAALWWFHSRHPENWDWGRITRVLKKNLPSRSKDGGYRLTGDIE